MKDLGLTFLRNKPEALGLKPTAAYRALYILSSWELVEDTGQRRMGPSGRPARV